MGEAKRVYDLLRGYVNREYDRIRGVELDEAERELNDVIAGSTPSKTSLSSANTPAVGSVEPVASREERARRILGVTEQSSFDEIRRAFERLNKRGDPSRFPGNSPEREHAASIQKSVQWAYGVLTVNVDATEKRFRSLEIE
ncbi:MAG TPA: J domain-containing protein [Fimbriimonadaceae bacterium]|nr:J domain-containing protein [Fimbriimonadaceae bacterium]